MELKTKNARTTARRAGQAAVGARENPYVKRFIEDPELRENVREAFEAARHAYRRMSNGKRPAKALMEDKKLQRDLRDATESLREAADQIRGKRRRKRHRGRRLLLLAIVGAGAVLIVSAGARQTALDKIFGAEEEFEYTSTTTPTT
jgi:ferric-dicitrate binding protein FerR (iron transport regulator)